MHDTNVSMKTVPLLLLSIISLYVHRYGVLSGFTIWEFMQHLRYVFTVLYYGRKTSALLKKSWDNSEQAQRQNLEMILAIAPSTEYGEGWEINSVEEFRDKVPISEYPRYIPYVIRSEWHDDVMFPGKPIYIGTTTGTTGQAKTHPKSKIYFDLVDKYLTTMGQYYVYTTYPSCVWKKVVHVDINYTPVETETGLNKAQVGWKMLKYSPSFTIPEDGFKLTNSKAATYLNLLFSLKERNVGIIYCLFSGALLTFFRNMEKDWEDICTDIELGRIRTGYFIPDETSRKLRAKFSADPKRANELRVEFKKGFDDIAKRIWPGIRISVVITSGAFKAAGNICDKIYLKTVPNFARAHGSAEAFFGINRDQEGIDPYYCLISPINFYELIPIDCGDVILPEEAEIDKLYELVVTTHEGLYRYRTTDVIQATGRRGTALTYRYIQRIGDFLSIESEMTPVCILENFINALLGRQEPAELLYDYTTSLSTYVDDIVHDLGLVSLVKEERHLQRYWIFIEINSTNLLPSHFEQKLENRLTKDVDSYNKLRERKSCGHLVVVQVNIGTFRMLKDALFRSRGLFTYSQYKTSRVTREGRDIRLLLQNACCVE